MRIFLIIILIFFQYFMYYFFYIIHYITNNMWWNKMSHFREHSTLKKTTEINNNTRINFYLFVGNRNIISFSLILIFSSHSQEQTHYLNIWKSHWEMTFYSYNLFLLNKCKNRSLPINELLNRRKLLYFCKNASTLAQILK